MTRFWGNLFFLGLICFASCNDRSIKKGDYVLVQYTLKTASGLRIDDSSCGCGSKTQDDNPIKIKVGYGWVIEGWDEALLDMKVEQEKIVVIQSAAGFGTTAPPHGIATNDTLILWLKVVKILD